MALSRVRGILIISGNESQFAVSRFQRPPSRHRDVRVDYISDACRMLMQRRFEMILVLPGAQSATDMELLVALADLANGSPVLVVSDTGARISGSKKANYLDSPLTVLASSFMGTEQYRRVSMGPLTGEIRSGVIMIYGKIFRMSLIQSRIMWRILRSPEHTCPVKELVAEMPNPESNNALTRLRVLIFRIRKNLAEMGVGGMLHTGSESYSLRWPPSTRTKTLV